jgi:diaminohydroxyphosphoribosylaminopyrimidine deaminase/5-amino-6-(5-phosphoribosylamino)uracil reductase
VLGELGRRSLQSVLVEGGATVASAFIAAGLVNKVSVFIAPKLIGACDRMADALELERVAVGQRGRDLEVTGYPTEQKK